MTEKIKQLIRDLIDLQDSIAHLQYKGPEYKDDVQLLIKERKIVHGEILNYIEYLEHKASTR